MASQILRSKATQSRWADRRVIVVFDDHGVLYIVVFFYVMSRIKNEEPETIAFAGEIFDTKFCIVTDIFIGIGVFRQGKVARRF